MEACFGSHRRTARPGGCWARRYCFLVRRKPQPRAESSKRLLTRKLPRHSLLLQECLTEPARQPRPWTIGANTHAPKSVTKPASAAPALPKMSSPAKTCPRAASASRAVNSILSERTSKSRFPIRRAATPSSSQREIAWVVEITKDKLYKCGVAYRTHVQNFQNSLINEQRR